MKKQNIEIQKYIGKPEGYWQIYTRNLLGMQVFVGVIETLPEVKKYVIVIEQAEKTFKKRISEINNSKEM